MSTSFEKTILSPVQKNIILHGEMLNHIHMKHFNKLLRYCSDYRPVETWQQHYLHTIQLISEHIQILFSSSGPCASDRHWVCSYYDKKNLFIYDSLNKKGLQDNDDQLLSRLFPTYPFNKRLVKFPTVQNQTNNNDSGIFAIAFAISLLFNIKPEKVKYDCNLMRLHLIKIFESNTIKHFPQDSKYVAIQKVLPLQLLKVKESEASRIRKMRQNKKQEKQPKQDLRQQLSIAMQTEDISDLEKDSDVIIINNSVKQITSKNSEHITDKHRQVHLKDDKHNERQSQQISVKKKTEKPKTLLSDQKQIILQGDWLNDMHMEHFHYLLKLCSDFTPVDTWKLQLLDLIQPVPENKKHIQILYSSSGPGASDGHWVCSYYYGKNIFIYDSFNRKKLHSDHEQFWRRLFPTYSFDQLCVQFRTVQQQPNGNDCGVCAIAFTVSLLFNIKPEKVKYDHSLMRSLLIKIFESNVIDHFPQDPKCIPQKVIPLTMITTEETVVPSTIRNNVIPSRNLYILNNIENEVNNVTVVDNIVKEIDNESHKAENKNIRNVEVNNNITVLSGQFVQDINNNNESNTEENENKRHYLQSHARYEQHRYNRNVENNRAKKRCRYVTDVEENRAKKHRRYLKSLEENRSKKQRRYLKSLEENRAKKQLMYFKRLEENRAKKQRRYFKRLEKNRASKRRWYVQNLDANRDSKRRRYNANSKMRCMQERLRYASLM